jgi:hypothetical protein
LKHISSILAVTLLLGAGAFGFTSCASNEIKNPETPVTALKSEPASADSNELAPSVSIAPQKVQNYSAKPLPASHAASPVQPLSAAAAVVMVSPAPAKTGNSFWNSNWWPWLLLLIALLLVLKATQTLWARNRKKERDAELALARETGLTDEGILVQGGGKVPMVLAAKKARWTPVMDLSKSSVKEIAVTAFHNGKEHKMHFSPATTVKKVTAWAAYQCEIFDLNRTEVYLAIRGYSAPLSGTAHIGRFVMHDQHHLELDVVIFPKNVPVPETLLAKTPSLAKDEILVEGAGMTQVVPVAVKPNAPLQEVISSVARIGNFPPQDAFIFLENESKPLNPNLPLDENHPRHRIHHVHTQKEIAVTVFFNGKEHPMHFSPATTVKKVTAWADYQCEIFDQDAAETYLAIHGYSAPLPSGAHIGRFVMHDKKNLELDLLTFTKVTV